jgi:preflagellin peptidase FlaK
VPASVPDLLRLLAIPILVWAAYRDVKTRRVPNRTWQPLFVLAVVLFLWDGLASYLTGGLTWAFFVVGAGISLLIVIPASYGFWRFGAFGGADAKALIVLSLLFPTYPTYEIGSSLLPLVQTPTGAFSLTILSNTVLVGVCYPLVLATRNALAGRFTPLMIVGWPIGWDEAVRTHGRLLENPEGFTRSGLDLDALRMYLRWRDVTLSALREEPTRYRDPGSLPAEPYPAGDGMITDGRGEVEDDWGAEAFLADVGSAYGTTPDGLREGLCLLATRDTVWVSPGIPFLVPILCGLLISLTYGDLLTSALSLLGLL